MRVLAYLLSFLLAWGALTATALVYLPSLAWAQGFDIKSFAPLVLAFLGAAPYNYVGKLEGLLKDARIPAEARSTVDRIARRRQAALWALTLLCALIGLAPMLLKSMSLDVIATCSLVAAIPLILIGAGYVIRISFELSRWERRLGDTELTNKKHEQRRAEAERLRGKLSESVRYP